MIHKWFYTGEDSGTAIYGIEIEENNVSSIPANDVERGIRIPFRLERNLDWRQKNVYLDPILFNAYISWAGDKGLLRIAEARPISDPRNPYFDIPLTLDKVELIETLRQGKDVKLVLDVFGTFVIGGPGYPSASSLFPYSVFNKHVVLAFTIPKSIWEDKVLPGLAIESLHSVTIRIPPNLRKPFAGSLRELAEAVRTLERATSESDYESVVNKTRITIESLLNQFSLRLPQKPDGTTDNSFKAKVEALRDQLLSPVLGKTHAEHTATVLLALWSPFSGAAHPGPTKFDRAYACFSIHQAAAILSIVSEALPG
jgi:hypothetical protein